MDELDLPEGATYAERLGRDGRGLIARKAATDAKADADGKTSRFILATGKEVRHNPMWQDGGDVLRVREFRLQNYRANPVFLLEHSPSQVIGRGDAKIVAVADDEHELHMAVHWDLHESNPTAVLIAGQHARGIRNAVSVGFMPGKGSMSRTKLPEGDVFRMDPEKTSSWRAGWVYRNPELYEGSSVSIPKDPNALQLRTWALESEDPDEQLRRIVSELVSREQAAGILAAVRADQAVRAAIAAIALEQVPVPHHADPPAPQGDWFKEWA